MLNQFTAMGRVVAPPNLIQNENGGLCQFRIAVQNSEKSTTFIDCRAFGKMGEAIALNFDKGRLIIVSGTLIQSEYVTQKGDKREKYEVHLKSWSFAGDGRNAEPKAPPKAEIVEDSDLPF